MTTTKVDDGHYEVKYGKFVLAVRLVPGKGWYWHGLEPLVAPRAESRGYFPDHESCVADLDVFLADPIRVLHTTGSLP